MTEPNQTLLKLYGNEHLVKTGSNELPVAARIGAAVLGLSLLLHDKSNRDEKAREAEMMNEIARLQEAERMRATLEALRKHGSLEKRAIGAFVGRAVGGAAKMFKGAPATQRLLQAGGTAVKKKPLIGWKGKALMGGTALGAGYLGLKGMQTARDVLTQRPQMGYGAQRTPLRHNVSRWGY